MYVATNFILLLVFFYIKYILNAHLTFLNTLKNSGFSYLKSRFTSFGCQPSLTRQALVQQQPY